MIQVIYGDKETFINTVLVNGQVIGLFKTNRHYIHYGSKRAIVEQIFNRYEAESNIEIISQSLSAVPLLID